MKLLYIHNTLPEYRYGFFRELNKKCDFTIAFSDFNLGENVYKEKITHDRLCEFKNIIFLKHQLKQDTNILESLIRKNNYDLIIFPALDDIYSIMLSNKLMKVAKKFGICTGLFWEKWIAPVKKQPLYRIFKEIAQFFLTDKIIKNIDILWSPGRKTDEYFALHNISINELHRIHDSSVCSKNVVVDIKKKYHIPDDSHVFLYLGRLVDYKGADVLIKAFAQMKNVNNSCYLIIAGFGPKEQEYKEFVEKNSVKNVVFTGFVESSLRASFYEACDVFVLPTKIYKGKIEAWGLTINEAMQFCKVVISTTAVASAQELISKDNGFIVEENNVQDLKNALEISITNDLKKSAFIEDNKIISMYSYKRMAEDIITGWKNEINTLI